MHASPSEHTWLAQGTLHALDTPGPARPVVCLGRWHLLLLCYDDTVFFALRLLLLLSVP